MTFFEILMSLSVSLIQSPNNSSKSAINLVDKGLYATMRGGRIDPSSCLDTCWVDDMAVWWFRATSFHGLKYLCVNREVLKQNFSSLNDAAKIQHFSFPPHRCSPMLNDTHRLSSINIRANSCLV